MSAQVETYGSTPLVEGRRCDGLICEQFWVDGVVHSSASVTYLNVEGVWHRLAVDHPTLHWHTQSEAPRPWAVSEEHWEYPHVDVGILAKVAGNLIRSIETSSDETTTRVAFV